MNWGDRSSEAEYQEGKPISEKQVRYMKEMKSKLEHQRSEKPRQPVCDAY